MNIHSFYWNPKVKRSAETCAHLRNPGKTRIYSVIGKQKTLESSPSVSVFTSPKNLGGYSRLLRPAITLVGIQGELLKFDSCSGFFKLLFDCFSFVFGCTFLHCGGHTFNQLLGIHQALASDVLNFFHDIQFLVAKAG